MNNKIQLDKLLNDKDVVQTTDTIRELKHSSHIRNCVTVILNLQKKYTRVSGEMFESMAKKHAEFLYVNYRMIFNKVIRNELNINILFEFINVLEKIENGELNQHSGSQLVGQKLKELYVDGLINKDKKTKQDLATGGKKKTIKPKKMISYKEFKILNED